MDLRERPLMGLEGEATKGGFRERPLRGLEGEATIWV